MLPDESDSAETSVELSVPEAMDEVAYFEK
jgi:hypothetical protein